MTLSEAWAVYQAKAFCGSTPPPEQVREMRRSFYQGSAAAFKVLAAGHDAFDLINEINKFSELVNKKAWTCPHCKQIIRTEQDPPAFLWTFCPLCKDPFYSITPTLETI